MASVLVTGGAGYIGSHMVKLLHEKGHHVTVLDNLSRGFRDAVIAGTFVEADLRDVAAVREVFEKGGFDVVMHFAALAYVGESVEKPAIYYENNVIGTKRLVDAMVEAGCPRIVFSSSCAVYGAPGEIPITERCELQAINPYGRTKLVSEHLLSDYAKAYGLQSIALRYFNAAGCDPDGLLGERHDPETHLVPLVLREARRVKAGGDPRESQLKVFGGDFPTPDGTCIRDYIHVSDLCRAHLHAMERLLRSETRGAESYNLGNGHGYSVKEIVEACRRVTGVEIDYQVVERRAGDPPVLVASADRAHRVLGWQPEFPRLDDILSSAWRWMR